MRKFIFCLSAGRTGTTYLATLLEANADDAVVHHEILNYDAFGVDTPELSHLLQFNSKGNTEWVKQFWRTKMSRVLAAGEPVYAETSHVLMKAGLVENSIHLQAHGELHFVILKRDWFKVIKSYLDRHDFDNVGSWWMWYLDPGYPKNMLSFERFQKLQGWGVCLWYLSEIACRAEYYRQRFSHLPNVHFHECNLEDIVRPEGASLLLRGLGLKGEADAVTIPPPINENKVHREYPQGFLAYLENTLESYRIDARDIAAAMIAKGFSFDPAVS